MPKIDREVPFSMQTNIKIEVEIGIVVVGTSIAVAAVAGVEVGVATATAIVVDAAALAGPRAAPLGPELCAVEVLRRWTARLSDDRETGMVPVGGRQFIERKNNVWERDESIIHVRIVVFTM